MGVRARWGRASGRSTQGPPLCGLRGGPRPPQAKLGQAGQGRSGLCMCTPEHEQGGRRAAGRAAQGNTSGIVGIRTLFARAIMAKTAESGISVVWMPKLDSFFAMVWPP
eukprot:366490-Chlamydomonas_euryale.AAC.38